MAESPVYFSKFADSERCIDWILEDVEVSRCDGYLVCSLGEPTTTDYYTRERMIETWRHMKK